MNFNRSSLDKPMRIFVLIIFVLASGCENMDGERTVSGKLPLESRTIEAELIADSLVTPEGSALLETRILSKAELGVVTKKFSTNHHCQDIDTFFRDYLMSDGWHHLSTEKRAFIDLEISSSFSREGFKIEVSCNELKDFRGIRIFYITCSW